jgi:hypothetical protein
MVTESRMVMDDAFLYALCNKHTITTPSKRVLLKCLLGKETRYGCWTVMWPVRQTKVMVGVTQAEPPGVAGGS